VLADAPAVLAVIAARDVADLGAADFTLEDLRDEWRASQFDLAGDALVADNGTGEIVAYAVLLRPGALVAVAPAYEGWGIGSRLLEWTERRQREQGRGCLRQAVGAANARGQELLRRAGYAPARSYFRMVRELTGGLAGMVGSDPPAGFRLRQLDPDGDAVAVHALDDASFAANPDYTPESQTAFREEHLGAHDLAPELSLVAEYGGAVAGFLLARHWRAEAAGFIDILAVGPEYRRRGLGQALLETGFAGFAAAGLQEAQLGVASDNPRALRLYERLGMRPRFRLDTFERAL
jgi:mycothiol synthase